MSVNPLYLLDTNILVHYTRQSRVGEFIERHYALRTVVNTPIISVVSLGEITSFAAHNNWGQRRNAIVASLINYFITVDINDPMILGAYADIDVYSRRNVPSKDMGKNDLWIAATARVTGATLLTTDRDFDHLTPSLLSRDYIDPMTLQITHN